VLTEVQANAYFGFSISALAKAGYDYATARQIAELALLFGRVPYALGNSIRFSLTKGDRTASTKLFGNTAAGIGLFLNGLGVAGKAFFKAFFKE
jgi:hypothetical protein